MYLARRLLPDPNMHLRRFVVVVASARLLSGCQSLPLGTVERPVTCVFSSGCETPPPSCYGTLVLVRLDSDPSSCGHAVKFQLEGDYWVADVSPAQ